VIKPPVEIIKAINADVDDDDSDAKPVVLAASTSAARVEKRGSERRRRDSAESSSESSSAPLPAPTAQQASFTLDPRFVEAVLEDRKRSSTSGTPTRHAPTANSVDVVGGAKSASGGNASMAAMELDGAALAARIHADRDRDVWRERSARAADDRVPGVASMAGSRVAAGAMAPHSTVQPDTLAHFKVGCDGVYVIRSDTCDRNKRICWQRRRRHQAPHSSSIRSWRRRYSPIGSATCGVIARRRRRARAKAIAMAARAPATVASHTHS
jgi:hypothetical protein